MLISSTSSAETDRNRTGVKVLCSSSRKCREYSTSDSCTPPYIPKQSCSLSHCERHYPVPDPDPPPHNRGSVGDATQNQSHLPLFINPIG